MAKQSRCWIRLIHQHMWQGKPLRPPCVQLCWTDRLTHWLEINLAYITFCHVHLKFFGNKIRRGLCPKCNAKHACIVWLGKVKLCQPLSFFLCAACLGDLCMGTFRTHSSACFVTGKLSLLWCHKPVSLSLGIVLYPYQMCDFRFLKRLKDEKRNLIWENFLVSF